MTRTNQDIPTDSSDVFVSGDRAVIDVTVENDDGSTAAIGGSTVTFALANYAGATPLVEKDSSDSDVTITDSSNGELSVTLQPSDTDDLGSHGGEDYHYEIEITDGNDNPATVTTGTFTIHADSA